MLPAPFIGRAIAATAITIAGPDGVFQQVFQTAVLDAFHRVRPDITVRYYAVSNPAQTLGLLRQRLTPPPFDVVLLSPRTGRAATTQDLLAPMHPETMPALAELIPAATLPGLAGRAAMVDSLAMAHGPGMASQPVVSWRTVWDPTKVQRIAIPAPPDTIGIGFTLVASRLFARGIDQASMMGAITAISHIAPRVVSWLPRPNVYDFVIDDHAALGIAWNSTGQIRAQRNPGRLRMSVPRDAPVHDIHTIHLVKRSPHPDAARAFAGFVLGTDGQTRIAAHLFMNPVNRLIRMPPEIAGHLVPLADPDVPLLGVDSPEMEALSGIILAGWRDRILRRR